MKIKKRHILLLEVLIALVLVSLCAFPLLAPHFMMINQEKLLLGEIEADRLANEIFVNIAEKMYTGEISWEALGSRESRRVDGALLNEVAIPPHWPYEMTYHFGDPKLKPDKKNPRLGLFPLWIEMTPKKGKAIRLFYEVFVEKGKAEAAMKRVKKHFVTLLELLIALGLTAVLLAALLGYYQQASYAQLEVHKKQEKNFELLYAQYRLNRIIPTILNPSHKDNKNLGIFFYTKPSRDASRKVRQSDLRLRQRHRGRIAVFQ